MRISVIVNNYNYARFVGEAIRSALEQDYADKEVIVVDDGSADASRSVIAGFGSRVTAIFKSNGGQASAMNAGFAACTGDLVLYLDADDYLQPGALAMIARSWRAGAAKAHWCVQVVDEAGTAVGLIDPLQEAYLARGDWKNALIERDDTASPPTSGNCFSRGCIERLLPIPERQFRIRADGYLVRGAVFQGEILAVPGVWSSYRVHRRNHCAGASAALSSSLDELHRRIEFAEFYRLAVARWAEAAGMKVAPDYEPLAYSALRNRLLSLTIDRARHPVARDSRRDLLRLILRALGRHSHLTWGQRVAKGFAATAFAVAPVTLRRQFLPAFGRKVRTPK